MATYIFRFPTDFAQEFEEGTSQFEIDAALLDEAMEMLAWYGRVQKFEEEDA